MAKNITPDILLHVAKYFEINPLHGEPLFILARTQKWVLNFCLVSKTFHEAFSPILQRTFLDRGHIKTRQKHLIRNIVYPAKAAKVRMASLSAEATSKESEIVQGKGLNIYSPPIVCESKQLTKFATSLSEDMVWLMGFQMPFSYPEAELALLVSRFENLEILELRCGNELGPSFNTLYSLFRTNTHWKKPVLPKLSKISLSPVSAGEQHGIIPKGLDRVLRRKNLFMLQTFELYMQRDQECFGSEMKKLIPKSSDIQVLELEHSDTHIDYFVALMKTFKGLKKVRLSWHPKPNDYDEPFPFDRLAESLLPQSQSLEDIRLYGMDFSFGPERFEGVFPPGSFKSFSVLKTMWLDGDLLVGTPVPMEEDKISAGDNKRFEKELAEYLHKRRLGKHPKMLTDQDYELMADIFPPSLRYLHMMSPETFTSRFRRVLTNIIITNKERLPQLETLDLSGGFYTRHLHWIQKLEVHECPIRLPSKECRKMFS